MNRQDRILLTDLSKGQLILIIEEQSIQIKELTSQCVKFCNEIAQLAKELEKYRHPKNSSNSYVSPSKDENRSKRNKSLRKKTGCKTGG